jgi:hypothetical protein
VAGFWDDLIVEHAPVNTQNTKKTGEYFFIIVNPAKLNLYSCLIEDGGHSKVGSIYQKPAREIC